MSMHPRQSVSERPLVVLALVGSIALVGCGPSKRVLAGDVEGGAGQFEILGEIRPGHIHTGDVVTMSFVVKREGVPVDGLSATLRYRQTSGGGEQGSIPAGPGAGSGQYEGKRAFSSAGEYTVDFEFPSKDIIVYKSFQYTVSPAH